MTWVKAKYKSPRNQGRDDQDSLGHGWLPVSHGNPAAAVLLPAPSVCADLFQPSGPICFGNNTVQQKNTRNTRHENTNLIWCCLTEILQSWAYFSILFGLDFVDILGFIDPSLVNWIPRSQRCQVAPLISPNESHRLTQFTHTLTSLVSSSSRIRAKIVSFP